jgi:hypothetical protein
MPYSEYSVEIANDLAIKDRSGNPVGFQGTDHVNVTSSFSDTIDLPGGPGYLYVAATCTLSIMLSNSSTALSYNFPQAGIYPLLVRRIRSTGSDTGVNVYIIR